jgi:hypothetical protein
LKARLEKGLLFMFCYLSGISDLDSNSSIPVYEYDLAGQEELSSSYGAYSSYSKIIGANVA